MIENEQLIKERKQSVRLIVEFKKELADHMVKAHGGISALICHKCLAFRQRIQSNEWLIRDIDNGIFSNHS